MLQSAYDFARKAVENAQLTEASALIKDFRSSEAYQWARGNRTTSTAGYDSSSVSEHGAANLQRQRAYGRARELARTAQFMREWSSGTQTDFTNYAARRLAERGLREEDPIKLQRGGDRDRLLLRPRRKFGNGYVPSDSPLGPSRPLPKPWAGPIQRCGSSTTPPRAADGTALGQQT